MVCSKEELIPRTATGSTNWVARLSSFIRQNKTKRPPRYLHCPEKGRGASTPDLGLAWHLTPFLPSLAHFSQHCRSGSGALGISHDDYLMARDGIAGTKQRNCSYVSSCQTFPRRCYFCMSVTSKFCFRTVRSGVPKGDLLFVGNWFVKNVKWEWNVLDLMGTWRVRI